MHFFIRGDHSSFMVTIGAGLSFLLGGVHSYIGRFRGLSPREMAQTQSWWRAGDDVGCARLKPEPSRILYKRYLDSQTLGVASRVLGSGSDTW